MTVCVHQSPSAFMVFILHMENDKLRETAGGLSNRPRHRGMWHHAISSTNVLAPSSRHLRGRGIGIQKTPENTGGPAS